MRKFLIEVPHEAAEIPCARAVKKFLELGSHLLNNAEWGCMDGVHKLWILIEAESKDQARLILPPMFRAEALIIGLNKYSNQEIDNVLGVEQEKVRS